MGGAGVNGAVPSVASTAQTTGSPPCSGNGVGVPTAGMPVPCWRLRRLASPHPLPPSSTWKPPATVTLLAVATGVRAPTT